MRRLLYSGAPRASRLPRRVLNWSSHQVGATCAALLLSVAGAGASEVTFTSPGFPASKLNEQGQLVEDWGVFDMRLEGEGVAAAASTEVRSLTLDAVIPAAQARSTHGAVTLTRTVFRAPAWPSGVDVVTVKLEETAGRERAVRLALVLPEAARLGSRTVSLGRRAVIALPANAKLHQTTRDWGWADDAVSLPGWAKPAVECDPAFRNIRAGLGGVPIHYQFRVEAGARCDVVLGFCESHWSQSGQRPVVCEVEGAKPEEVDPLARWGQHQPGALLFAARDENKDGQLTVSVLPHPNSPDQNPILNVVWLFPPGQGANLEQVTAGKLNAQAQRYVDVGGEKDQPLHAGGQVEYAITLPSRGMQELTFLVGCAGGSVPAPERSAWTPEALRQAASRVWREWGKQ